MESTEKKIKKERKINEHAWRKRNNQVSISLHLHSIHKPETTKEISKSGNSTNQRSEAKPEADLSNLS
jgi:hypothetical protein